MVASAASPFTSCRIGNGPLRLTHRETSPASATKAKHPRSMRSPPVRATHPAPPPPPGAIAGFIPESCGSQTFPCQTASDPCRPSPARMDSTGDMQFFRHRLRQRRPDVLPDLHLAREHGDAAVLANVQPGTDFFRQRLAPSPPAAARLLRRRGRSSATDTTSNTCAPSNLKNSRRSTSKRYSRRRQSSYRSGSTQCTGSVGTAHGLSGRAKLDERLH